MEFNDLDEFCRTHQRKIDRYKSLVKMASRPQDVDGTEYVIHLLDEQGLQAVTPVVFRELGRMIHELEEELAIAHDTITGSK